MEGTEMGHKTLKTSLRRFSFNGGGFRNGKLSIDPAGSLILLEAVEPLINVALMINIYGANISRLQELERELKKIGL
jgi:hypothetical protein